MGFRGHTGIKTGMRAVLAVGFPAFPVSPLWVQDVPIWVQDVPIWDQDVPCASLVPFVPLRQRLLFYPLQPNASKGLSQTSRSFKSSQSFCAICASL